MAKSRVFYVEDAVRHNYLQEAILAKNNRSFVS